MVCPYCKKNMREGFVQGGRGVFFSESERNFIYRPIKRKGDIVIAGLFACSAPANYCDNCKCLIVKNS